MHICISINQKKSIHLSFRRCGAQTAVITRKWVPATANIRSGESRGVQRHMCGVDDVVCMEVDSRRSKLGSNVSWRRGLQLRPRHRQRLINSSLSTVGFSRRLNFPRYCPVTPRTNNVLASRNSTETSGRNSYPSSYSYSNSSPICRTLYEDANRQISRASVNGFPLYSTVCREDVSRRVGGGVVYEGVSSGVGREGRRVGREAGPRHGIRTCWFGSKCKYQFCPFWHPRSERIADHHVGLQKFVTRSKGLAVPRMALAPERRGLPPAGQGIADSRASVVQRTGRGHGQPKSSLPLKQNGISSQQLKSANYWDTFRTTQRPSIRQVGRAAVLQTLNNKKQTAAMNERNNVSENSSSSNRRGQPTDTRSGCQRRPPCGPVKRTYANKKFNWNAGFNTRNTQVTSQNTHTHTHTHCVSNTEERLPHSTVPPEDGIRRA